jgi:TonB family protein
MLLTAAMGSAGEVKLIANPSVAVDVITAGELKSVFLRETNWLKDGTYVEPVLQKSGPTHDEFLKHYLRKSDPVLQTYYRSLVFTGKGTMPKILGSDSEVTAYVTKTRGAIGYVGSESDTGALRTLTIVEKDIRVERALISRVEPEYPILLRQRFIGGTVRLQVTIEREGDVRELKILGGDAALAQAAVEAVRKWKYKAAPSRTITAVVITFDPRQK